MPREHGDKGEFVETTTLDDVRAVFDQVEGPVVLSADVSDQLDCTRETARRKLEKLHDRGDLDRRKVARRMIYWEPTESSTRSDPVDDATEQLDAGTTAESIDDLLTTWSHGTTPEARKTNEQIARRSIEWLRDRGTDAQKMDLPLEEFAADDPQDRKPTILWENLIQDAWKHVIEEHGAITKPTYRTYEWVGTDQ